MKSIVAKEAGSVYLRLVKRAHAYEVEAVYGIISIDSYTCPV